MASRQRQPSISKPKVKDLVLFDHQQEAPAPSQTYYQIVIDESKVLSTSKV
jgi:hypothetical protein